MANRVIITGRLTADPELRQTNQNTPVTSVSIAVPRKYKKDVTDFLDVVAWRKQAEFLCEYFSKGKWAEIDGRIETRTYTDKQGNKRKAVEIVADEVNFVGDKPKGEADANSTPPAPSFSASAGFDPFVKAIAAHTFDGGADDYGEYDEDGDLPF